MLAMTWLSAGCGQREALGRLPAASMQLDVRRAGDRVLEAMRAKNGPALAKLVHPERGVRFSPYAYVDVGADRVLTRAQVRRLWESTETFVWGTADGTGEPIELTPAEYFERFVIDRDFARANSVRVNDDRATGNTVNNAAAVYPNGTRVEYYLEPEPGDGEPAFDWRALRLVFELHERSWMLIGVIHDQWTM